MKRVLLMILIMFMSLSTGCSKINLTSKEVEATLKYNEDIDKAAYIEVNKYEYKNIGETSDVGIIVENFTHKDIGEDLVAIINSKEEGKHKMELIPAKYKIKFPYEGEIIEYGMWLVNGNKMLILENKAQCKIFSENEQGFEALKALIK